MAIMGYYDAKLSACDELGLILSMGRLGPSDGILIMSHHAHTSYYSSKGGNYIAWAS